MKSNTKLSAEEVVSGYIDFLSERGFTVSLCNLDPIFHCCYDSLMLYLGHKTEFCLRVKENKKPLCIEWQKQLINQVSFDNFGPFVCFAGVSEYVFPIDYENKRYGIICLSKNADKGKVNLDKNLAKTIILPLCYAFEKLIKQIEEEYFLQKELSAREKTYYQILNYIANNLNRKITIKDICDITHYSQTYVSREFKRLNGKSLIDYVLDFKIKTAKKFLEKTNLSISDIAFKVGYENPNDFTSIFKKKVGLNPKKYRENEKKR